MYIWSTRFKLVLAVLMTFCVGAFATGCGDSDSSQDAASEIQEQSDVAAAQNAPGAKTDCGDGVQAGPNTSCSFAENVASEFRSSGETSLSVYSPTTGGTYTMSCGPWADSGTVCEGGKNASVYITD